MPLLRRRKTDTTPTLHAPDGATWRIAGPAAEDPDYLACFHRAGFTEASASDEATHVVLSVEPPEQRKGPQAFLDALRDQHGSINTQPVRLHHPAVAAGLSPLPDLGAWAVNGYPGAGNMVLQGLLNEIDHLRGPIQAPAEPRPLLAWSRDFGAVIDAWVRQFLQQLNHPVEDFVISPGNLGQCSVRVVFRSGATLLLNHLPQADFLGKNYGAHCPWTDEAAAFFPRFGYRRVYHVVRDPIAIMASNAAKTVRPLEHALHDEAWFRGVARQMARYLGQADAQREAYTLIRYEDVITRPVEVIHQLAKDAGVQLDDAGAQTIWDKVGFKPITPAGTEHLFDPTADKTRHYRRRHLEIMREVGLDRWFESYGYTMPEAGALPDGDLEPPTQVEKVPSTLYGRVDPRKMHEVRDPDLPLWIRASDPDLLQEAHTLIRDTWLCRMMETLSDDFGKLALPGQ